MKTLALKAERKFFPSFNLKLSPKSAIPFVLECAAIFLFASVGKFGFALSLALFCGFVYARQNILLIAPCFLLATFVFTLDWQAVLFALSPVAVLLGVYFACFKMKRNVPVWAVALGAVVGLSPYAVCGVLFGGDYLLVGTSALITLVGTFCCSIASYALFVRRVFGKATVDEMICAGFVVAVLGYALAGVNIYGFPIISMIIGGVVVLASACLPSAVTLFFALLMGVGASVRMGSVEYLGVAVAVAGASVAFSPFSRIPSALSVLAVEGVFWLFQIYGGAGWKSLVMSAVGVIIAVCIPKRVVTKVESLLSNNQKFAYSSIVNRRGKDIANRLYATSDVFFDTSKTLERFADEKCEYTPQRLAKEIARNYCAKCENKDVCFGALGEDTRSMLEPMTTAALARGKTSILDMPTFITSNCVKMHSLASVINSAAKAYIAKSQAVDELAVQKRLMSEQFAGIALVLDSLALETGAPLNFVGDEVETLKTELLRHNIVASDIAVLGRENDIQVSLIVRTQDAEKEMLAKVASKVLRTRLEVAKIQDRGKDKSVCLETAPTYEIAYGIAEKMRTGEDVSGDSRSVQNVSRSKRLFAICDGMGSGENAKKSSLEALNMIENFYRAGLKSDIVLNIVNRLLKISFDEGYSTLDVSVVDTKSGALDILKLGATSSFIVRKDSVEAVACHLPPAGILEDATPTTLRFQLFDGDMVVMMSDGVYDVLEDKGVVDVVDCARTSNPQTLANELLKRAVSSGADDDCTVLVTRLFCA